MEHFFNTIKEPWYNALRTLCQLEKSHKKLGEYLAQYSYSQSTYRICRAYILNVVRHDKLIQYFIDSHLIRPPKLQLKCFLKLVIGQILCKHKDSILTEAILAPIVNGWLERAKLIFSKAECKCINAVLRKLQSFFETFDTLPLHIRYNIPDFLITRYRKIYGEEALLKYLKWNCEDSHVYIRTQQPFSGLIPTQWEHFYIAKEEKTWAHVFQQVQQGLAYIQDPMTRIPILQLDLQENMSVLDLCAAPGGKTVQIAQILHGTGHVFSVDLPERLKRLQENTQIYTNVSLLGKDVRQLCKEDFKSIKDGLFDRVIVDVPCSNTGVIQKKPDIALRLKESDFIELPQIQCQLLEKASTFLKRHGLLIYSTCSIDPGENQAVVTKFLQTHPQFRLKHSHVSLPWIDGHDGGGCFCLEKKE